MMRLWDKKHKHDRLTVFPSGEYSANFYLYVVIGIGKISLL